MDCRGFSTGSQPGATLYFLELNVSVTWQSVAGVNYFLTQHESGGGGDEYRSPGWDNELFGIWGVAGAKALFYRVAVGN